MQKINSSEHEATNVVTAPGHRELSLLSLNLRPLNNRMLALLLFLRLVAAQDLGPVACLESGACFQVRLRLSC